MFKRKFLLLVPLLAAGSTGLGLALADDPKSIPIPTSALPMAPGIYRVPTEPPAAPSLVAPRVMPATPNVSGDSPVRPATVAAAAPPAVDLEKQAQEWAKALKPGEKQVLFDVKSVQMDLDFVSQIGLAADQPKEKATSSVLQTCLTRREGKLLTALIRAHPAQLDILCRPQLTVRDGQTGFFQMGVNQPQGLPVDKRFKDAEGFSLVRIVSEGHTLKVTPRVSRDNGYIMLRLEPQNSRVVDPNGGSENLQLSVPPETKGPIQKTEFTAKPGSEPPTFTTVESVQLQATVVIPVGNTVVIGKKIETQQIVEEKNLLLGTTARRTEPLNLMLLWIITPHLAVGK